MILLILTWLTIVTMCVMMIMSLAIYDRIENANTEPDRFASEEIAAGLYARIHRAKEKLAPTPEPELTFKESNHKEPQPGFISEKRKKQLGINW